MSGGVSRDLTIGDLLRNPKRFGLPTLEEFGRNRDRWLNAKDSAFDAIEDGAGRLLPKLKKHFYIVQLPDGTKIKCGKSIEKAYEELRNHGYYVNEVTLVPELRDDHSTGIICEVYFKCPSRILLTPGARP